VVMSIVRLKCLSEYSDRGLRFIPGQVIKVSPELAMHLLRKAPDGFEILERSFDEPPMDKMIKRPERKK